jgi:ribosomal protein S18 acetylase RimI-like enzyme
VALRLRPLRDDELPAFIAHGRAGYAHELETQAGLSSARAQTKAEADWARLLPDGTMPPGHHLYAVEDADSGERIGELWWAEREGDGGATMAYVYSIEVMPEHRGRGYGRETMVLFEEDARDHGITALALTVLGGNEIARSLYRSLGYVERAVHMAKDV